MLIAVISGPTLAEAEEQIRRADKYATGFELRLDLLACDLSILRAQCTKPVLITCRKQVSLQTIESALALAPDFCDFEADTDPLVVQTLAKKFPAVRFLGSTHNFRETPLDLEALFRSMQRPEFFHYKIAVKAQSTLDFLRLMEFAKGRSNLSWISMGADGEPSRVLARATGSQFSYTGLNEQDLHQIDGETLASVYRFGKITPQTEVFALIGDPVDASIGHLYHNATLPETAVYVKLRVAKGELGLFFTYARSLQLAGLSVTMPHKVAVIPFLNRVDPTAQAIGAVNTIRREQGKFTGFNTDGEGALNAIERHLTVSGREIALIGAGGAARAILYEANRRGANLHIYNRTFETGLALAKELGGTAHPLRDLNRRTFDLVINTLPSTVGVEVLPEAVYAMDIAVSNTETPFVQKIAARGCKLISWKEMFEHQAALQQRIWGF